MGWRYFSQDLQIWAPNPALKWVGVGVARLGLRILLLLEMPVNVVTLRLVTFIEYSKESLFFDSEIHDSFQQS